MIRWHRFLSLKVNRHQQIRIWVGSGSGTCNTVWWTQPSWSSPQKALVALSWKRVAWCGSDICFEITEGVEGSGGNICPFFDKTHNCMHYILVGRYEKILKSTSMCWLLSHNISWGCVIPVCFTIGLFFIRRHPSSLNGPKYVHYNNTLLVYQFLAFASMQPDVALSKK